VEKRIGGYGVFIGHLLELSDYLASGLYASNFIVKDIEPSFGRTMALMKY
jgi:hypothetical protein